MEDGDLLRTGSCGISTNGSAYAKEHISDDIEAAKFVKDSDVNEILAPQSGTTELTDSEDADYEGIGPETRTPLRKPRTKRGRNGKKWVSLNWEHKEWLKKKCEYLCLTFVAYPYTATDGKMPYSKALTTSSFPNDQVWSEDNLPDILFYIKPPTSEYEGQPVLPLKKNGKIVKVGGKAVRDFPILPRRISLEVPGWLVEAWRRIDPRITYPDILARQIEDAKLGLKKLGRNALQNHCRRECRMILGNWTSYERREVPHRTDVEAIERLSYQNVMLNTILNVCPGRQDRLTKIRLTKRSQDGCGRYYAVAYDVNEINLYETTFPIDHFVLKSRLPADDLHSMDRSMMAAWELSLILQERARFHNLCDWRKLADSCKPVSWFDRTANKRVENDTFDGGCPVCTWVPSRDQRLDKEWIDEVKPAGSKRANRKPSATKGPRAVTSKRRKLKNGKSQDVSMEVEDESDQERGCCKEAKTFKYGSTTGHHPSGRFQNGGFNSYCRNAGQVEEAQGDISIANSVAHNVAEEREHRAIEQKAGHSVTLGIGHLGSAEDREPQLVSGIRLPPEFWRASGRLTPLDSRLYFSPHLHPHKILIPISFLSALWSLAKLIPLFYSCRHFRKISTVLAATSIRVGENKHLSMRKVKLQ